MRLGNAFELLVRSMLQHAELERQLQEFAAPDPNTTLLLAATGGYKAFRHGN